MSHRIHMTEQAAVAGLEPQLGDVARARVAHAYDLHGASLYAFCLSRLASRQAAEDVVQETFARFSAMPIDDVENPRAWLFAVARNLCTDVGRRSSRSLLDDSATREELESVACGTDSSAEALSKEEAAELLLALRRITPRYRTALILREVHGLPVSEIAEALETTEGATHTLLSRARDALGKAVAEVSEAPQACRRAMMLSFKRSGTGISPNEARALDAHLASCPECRRRVRQAERPTALAALLPLLTAPDLQPTGLIARAMAALGDHSFIPALSSCAQPAAKTVGTVLLAAAMIGPSTSAMRRVTLPDTGTVTAMADATPRQASAPKARTADSGEAQHAGRSNAAQGADEPERARTSNAVHPDDEQGQASQSQTVERTSQQARKAAEESAPSESAARKTAPTKAGDEGASSSGSPSDGQGREQVQSGSGAASGVSDGAVSEPAPKSPSGPATGQGSEGGAGGDAGVQSGGSTGQREMTGRG